MYSGWEYYPDHFSDEKLKNDICMIKKSGAKILIIGKYLWPLLEQCEGIYQFYFIDKLINEIKENNLKASFVLPSQIIPKWLSNQINIEGVAAEFHSCNSVYVRNKFENFLRLLITRYNSEECIEGWVIDSNILNVNETECSCKECNKDFVSYLENKYIEVDVLNSLWSTSFWGKPYKNFSEISLPVGMDRITNPRLTIDFYQFKHQLAVETIIDYRDTIKMYKGKDQILIIGNNFDMEFHETKELSNFHVV